jgi:hypothetical protein
MKQLRMGMLAVCLLTVAPLPTRAQECDRACLARTLDQFLDAVVAHDPARAPLADTFRYTENALEVRKGEGLWKSATALGPVQRRYLDAVTGQAAYFGLIQEGGESGIATLRLRVVNRRVTEGELVIGRRATGIFNAENFVANPPVERRVAPADRASREAMVAAANSYFDGLQSKSSAAITARPGCVRIENGVTMTGVRPGRGQGAAPVDLGDCANMSNMGQIADVVARRFPVVDEEAGVVLGMAVFNRPPGAKRANGTLWPRNLLTEIFLLDRGRIDAIYAAMHYLEPDVPTAPGW